MSGFHFQSMGPSAVSARMRQIQARLDSVFPKPGSRASASGEPFHLKPMYGTIGKNGVTPLNPFGQAADVEGGPTAPDELKVKIHMAAQNAGLDPLLFEALIGQESGYNPQATSNRGAMGLSQIMPDTARSLGIADPYDPDSNLKAGARYLSQLMTQFNGQLDLALAGYNAGPGAVKKYGGIPPYKETQDYVRKIIARYNTLRQP